MFTYTKFNVFPLWFTYIYVSFEQILYNVQGFLKCLISHTHTHTETERERQRQRQRDRKRERERERERDVIFIYQM